MYGASGTIAAVTEVHFLCDVSCCLTVDQEATRKFLVDRHENVNKISCFVG